MSIFLPQDTDVVGGVFEGTDGKTVFTTIPPQQLLHTAGGTLEVFPFSEQDNRGRTLAALGLPGKDSLFSLFYPFVNRVGFEWFGTATGQFIPLHRLCHRCAP